MASHFGQPDNRNRGTHSDARPNRVVPADRNPRERGPRPLNSYQTALFQTAFALGVAILISVFFVFIVPPGEAPDEPAHLEYLNQVVEKKGLPPVEDRPVGLRYEFYQPPLPYLAMAVPLCLTGVRQIHYPFIPNPDFSFGRNQRAFLNPDPSPSENAAHKAVRLARAVNVLWLLTACSAILGTSYQISTSHWIAFGAGLPFALSPQLLFAGSTIGNDAAVVAVYQQGVH